MYERARIGSTVGSIALLTLFLGACDIAVGTDGGFDFSLGAKVQDQWTRTYKLPAGGRLELININGEIKAEAGEGDTVQVIADRTGKATSEAAAREVLAKTEMREEVGETRVRIEARPPRAGRVGHEFKWTVKVPKGVAVDLRTTNGGVTLVGLAGDVRARSTNGGIKGTQIAAANVDASVTNGGVQIELLNAPTGSIDLESVNGGVSLALPAESKANVSARCVNGGISVIELGIEVIGEKSQRRLEGKLNGGGAQVTLETVNGGVRISRATT